LLLSQGSLHSLSFRLGCLRRRPKFSFLCDHRLNSVVHVLNQVHFGAAQPPLVRNVVNVVVSFRVLAVRATDLHVELVCNCLEVVLALAQHGQVDVH